MSERLYYAVSNIKLSWEPWFAWRPVKTIEGRRVWLRRIERRTCHFIYFYTEYRLPPSHTKGRDN